MNKADSEQLARRVVLAAVQESHPLWWLRKAAEWDRVGTPEAPAVAAACRAKAEFLARYTDEVQVDVLSFAHRVVLESLQEAEVRWWDRRAVTFERVGSESADEAADACRAKARMVALYGGTDVDLDHADLCSL